MIDVNHIFNVGKGIDGIVSSLHSLRNIMGVLCTVPLCAMLFTISTNQLLFGLILSKADSNNDGPNTIFD